MDAASLGQHGIRPIIHEIIRTEVIFQNITLLVEHMVVQDAAETSFGSPRRGFRVYLTDGEKRIQGVVRRRLHKTMLQMDVGRGSVIALKQYKLATAKRLNSEGEILYFAIADFYVSGHQRLPDIDLDSVPGKPGSRDSKDARRSMEEAMGKANASDALFDRTFEFLSGRTVGENEEDESQLDLIPIKSGQQSRLREASIPRDPEWIRRASIEHHQRCHLKVDIPDSERCPPTDDARFEHFCAKNPLAHEYSPCESIAHHSLLAMVAGTPLRPFRDEPKIFSLASVTGRNKSRNQDVDVLAIIESIDSSTTKPPKLSLKRDIRILDPSVDGPVTLSVFNDPVNFQTKVGTIALFRHVTTHDWRRGNLNAYPARVAGREWFIPNPHCLGLRDQIRHIEEWWTRMQRSSNVKATNSPYGSG